MNKKLLKEFLKYKGKGRKTTSTERREAKEKASKELLKALDKRFG